MKTLIKNLVLFIFCAFGLSSNAQEKGDIYIVKQDVLKYLIKKNNLSTAYITKTITTLKQDENTYKKVISEKYDELENEIKNLEAEKIIHNLKNDSITNKYLEINSIIVNIDQYLQSQKAYSEKKYFLKNGQLMAFKYGITELIYADKEINSSQKSKFLVLSLNPIDMKFHLKKVKTEIQKLNKKPDLIPYDEVLLNNTKLAFKEEKPFYYVEIPGKKTSISKTIATNEIKDISILFGKFKYLDDCYIIIKDPSHILDNNQIVMSAELENKNIDLTRTIHTKMFLIKNIETNKTYVVEPNFLTTFGYPFTPIN